MVPSDPHSRLTLEIALIGHGMGDPWPLHFNRPVGQWRFLDGEAKDNWSSFVSVGFSTMNDLNGIHPSDIRVVTGLSGWHVLSRRSNKELLALLAGSSPPELYRRQTCGHA